MNNKKDEKQNHIFGPVHSRRLGLSLGIDVIPFKTCTLNCIYCEQGQTTNLTTLRSEYVPLEDVLLELETKLKTTTPDHITIAGSGEPLLYSRLKELISGIKELTNIPLVLLTNGTLLHMQEIRESILNCDIVMPSIDAVTQKVFNEVNCPHKDLQLDQILNGFIQFSKEFQNKLWIEILLIKNISDSSEHLSALKDFVKQLNPNKILLNTVARPPWSKKAIPMNEQSMNNIKDYFGEQAEVISTFKQSSPKELTDSDNTTQILELLKRRPCPFEEIQTGLNISTEDLEKKLDLLLNQKNIIKETYNNQTYYRFNQ